MSITKRGQAPCRKGNALVKQGVVITTDKGR